MSQISGERLQDHWGCGSSIRLFTLHFMFALINQNHGVDKLHGILGGYILKYISDVMTPLCEY